jgi:uncharacterized protein YkwD
MAVAAPLHRPIRRLSAAAGVVAVALLLAGCLTPGQESVLNELNADRRAYGRSTLSIHDQAQAKAQAWAEKLAREGRLYHSTLESGITARWCGLGENVGYGGTVAQIQDAYMKSSGHRANILNTSWNGVGVGHATGKVNGVTVIFTVHSFIQTC